MKYMKIGMFILLFISPTLSIVSSDLQSEEKQKLRRVCQLINADPLSRVLGIIFDPAKKPSCEEMGEALKTMHRIYSKGPLANKSPYCQELKMAQHVLDECYRLYPEMFRQNIEYAQSRRLLSSRKGSSCLDEQSDEEVAEQGRPGQNDLTKGVRGQNSSSESDDNRCMISSILLPRNNPSGPASSYVYPESAEPCSANEGSDSYWFPSWDC